MKINNQKILACNSDKRQIKQKIMQKRKVEIHSQKKESIYLKIASEREFNTSHSTSTTPRGIDASPQIKSSVSPKPTGIPIATPRQIDGSLSNSLPTHSNLMNDQQNGNFSMESELETTRIQSNSLKEQLDSIFTRYEEQSIKLMNFEKSLNDREISLHEREEKVAAREETLKHEEEQMKKAFEEETSEIMKDLTEREENIVNLEKKISSFTSIETKLGKNQAVKLNVGGKIFATNLVTLKSVKDTFFTGYFNDHFNPTAEDDDNAFFIDRPNELFHLILNFLRGIDIEFKIKSLNECDLRDFIEEIVFYQLTPIYEILPQNGKTILKAKYSINLNENQTVTFNENPYFKLESPTRVKQLFGGTFGIIGSETNEFKVKLISISNLLIGFASDKFNINGSNENSCGYYIFTTNGKLYSQKGHAESYVNQRIKDGSIIECKFENGNISYRIDDVDCGIAFRNIPNTPQLFPAFQICGGNNSTFELINE